tara:strand:- start:441 stop:968 length:528 start_codon:yes stop_codon:yes gene_type:complete
VYKEVRIKWSIYIVNLYYKNLLSRVNRIISYYKLRLARLPGSNYAISSGFACGAMVSFTPLLGFHFILAIIFAYLIRGNFIAALIGTVVGNPVTFPFIWGLIYKIGTYVTNIKVEKINHEINFDMIVSQTYEIFFPMLVGGVIIAPLVWVITYFVIYSFITSFKRRKNKKNKRLF